MTVISSLITSAYRADNIIPLGTVPNANQVAEALLYHNQNVQSTLGSEVGEQLADWPLGTFGYDDPFFVDPRSPDCIIRPAINQRLIANNIAPITVYLTPYPQNGSRMGIADQFGRLATYPVTLDANGRTIEGNATKVLNVSGTFQEWFYRADLGQWVKLTSLLATDDNPFPADFDIYFIVALALRVNPGYGRTMDPQTSAAFKSARAQFVAAYLQSRPLEADDSISWPFMSRQSYNQQRSFSSNTAFNTGRYGGS